MHDKSDVFNLGPRHSPFGGAAARLSKETEADPDADEVDSCPAFGYLHGIRDRALAVELRFLDGNSHWFPYSWLGPWQYNPSVGLLLKFTGDVVSLVLIRGSNLDALVNQGGLNLPLGLQRQRIVWLREMDEGEIRKVGEKGPTIDQIQVAEFDSIEELRTWLGQEAPAFAPKR